MRKRLLAALLCALFLSGCSRLLPDPVRAAAYEKKYGVFKRLYPALKDIPL